MTSPYRPEPHHPRDAESHSDRAVLFDLLVALILLALGAVVVRTVWALESAQPLAVLREL